jgi:hypothetical protein
MPSLKHERFVEMYRVAPEFAVQHLVALGVRHPALAFAKARLVDSTFPAQGSNYAADVVVACDDSSEVPNLVIIVEVQLSIDPDKRRSWPFYQASAIVRMKCDACVLVVTLDEEVATWARAPIGQEPSGSMFKAIVVGPSDVSHNPPEGPVRPPPGLALLSAIYHGQKEPKLVGVALASMAELSEEARAAYYDLLRYHAGKEIFEKALEAMMGTSEHKYLSDFAQKYYGEGKVEGKAEGKAEGVSEALLAVLAARGLTLSENDRARVAACTDLATLGRWLTRAARATGTTEVFED